MENTTHHTVMVGDDPMTAEEVDFNINWYQWTEKMDEGYSETFREPLEYYSDAERYYWDEEASTPFQLAVLKAWEEGDISCE